MLMPGLEPTFEKRNSLSRFLLACNKARPALSPPSNVTLGLSLLWVQISEERLTAYGVMSRSDTDSQAPCRLRDAAASDLYCTSLVLSSQLGAETCNLAWAVMIHDDWA